MGKIKRDVADTAFSNYIRERDNWTCQRCGKQYDKFNTSDRQGLHCSHFKGRGKEATRFLPENCDALCYGCHQYFTSQPNEHVEWQVARKGQKVIDEIILLSNSYKKKDRKAEAAKWRAALTELELDRLTPV